MRMKMAFIILFGYLFSCQTQHETPKQAQHETPKALGDVKIGMSIDEVKQMLGYPSSQMNGHTELMQWNDMFGNLFETDGDDTGHIKHLGQLVEITWFYADAATKIDTIRTPQYLLDNCRKYNEEMKKFDHYDIFKKDCSEIKTHRYEVASILSIIFDRSTGTVGSICYLPLSVREIQQGQQAEAAMTR